MLEALREEVLQANREIARLGLALFTFGNASAIDRKLGLIVIKPSGVPYAKLRAEDLVVTDMQGHVVEGSLRPSSDLPTHLVLYQSYPGIGGIVHTHSHYATVWAQAGREIPCLGTTHADHFHGPVPITATMAAEEIVTDYEVNTGHAILRRLEGIDPMSMPAVLVSGHASFCWGSTMSAAVETAAVLEEVAKMAFHTAILNHDHLPISSVLHDKHFLRKHGAEAYYGQK